MKGPEFHTWSSTFHRVTKVTLLSFFSGHAWPCPFFVSFFSFISLLSFFLFVHCSFYIFSLILFSLSFFLFFSCLFSFPFFLPFLFPSFFAPLLRTINIIFCIKTTIRSQIRCQWSNCIPLFQSCTKRPEFYS